MFFDPSLPRTSYGQDYDLDYLNKDMLRQYLRHELGKCIRPWDVTNVTARLDPTKVWMGLEWETGTHTEQDFKRLVNWMYTNINSFTIDGEGVGEWYGEVTLPPEHLDDIVEGRGQFWDTLHYFNQELGGMPSGYCGWRDEGDAREGWGMHINLSTPATRGDRNGLTAAIQILNRSLDALSMDQRLEFFGRNPYGLGYVRGNSESSWAEFKLFQTTDCATTIAGYFKVAKRLAVLLDTIYAKLSSLGTTYSVRQVRYDGYTRLQFGSAIVVGIDTASFLRGDSDEVQIAAVEHSERSFYSGARPGSVEAHWAVVAQMAGRASIAPLSHFG